MQDIRVGIDGNVYNSAGEAVREQIKSSKQELNNIKNEELNGNTSINFINATWTGDGKIEANSARICPSEIIKVSANTTIKIKPGNFCFAVGIWKDKLSRENLIRNDNIWSNFYEVINVEEDGYFMVSFANVNDTTVNISPSDFDGSIRINRNIVNDISNKFEDISKVIPFDNQNIELVFGGTDDKGNPNDVKTRVRFKDYFDISKKFISIQMEDDTYSYGISTYDKNGEYISWIPYTLGSNITSIKTKDYNKILVLFKSSQNEYLNLENNLEEIKSKLKIITYDYENVDLTPIKIRVATYNIGHFAYGTSPIPAGTLDKLQDFRNAIVNIRADIIGLTEDDVYYDSNSTMKVYDNVYKMFKYYGSGIKQGYTCNSILSKFEIFNLKSTEFATKSTHAYTECDIKIYDKMIHFVSTQVSWQDINTRKAQYQELIKIAKKYEYCIIVGDMNPSARINLILPEGVEPNSHYKEDYAIWENAGFNIANVGFFGEYNTLIDKDYPGLMLPYDNIFTTKNIDISFVETFENDMSDHYAIAADICIY